MKRGDLRILNQLYCSSEAVKRWALTLFIFEWVSAVCPTPLALCASIKIPGLGLHFCLYLNGLEETWHWIKSLGLAVRIEAPLAATHKVCMTLFDSQNFLYLTNPTQVILGIGLKRGCIHYMWIKGIWDLRAGNAIEFLLRWYSGRNLIIWECIL